MNLTYVYKHLKFLLFLIVSWFNIFLGWTKTLTEWNEFLAENLHESNDALQECFVQVKS